MTSSINPIDALWGGIELSKQEKSTDVRRDHSDRYVESQQHLRLTGRFTSFTR